MVQPFPAPSLRELSRPSGVTEGVSFDGSSVPMVYTPAHIGSEIFERLRATKYTPSVSHSLDSSLREGAGVGLYHSTRRPKTARFRAIFIAPTKLRGFWLFTFIGVHSLSLAFARQLPQGGSRGGAGAIHRTARKPGGCGRFSSPLRNSEIITAQKSSGFWRKNDTGWGRALMYGNQPGA